MILPHSDGFFASLVSLWIFIIFMVGTPGPANLLMMTIGSQIGTKAAMRFNAGLVSGKVFLNLMMALGVGVFLKAHPVFLDALKYLSAIVMIYLSLLTLQNKVGSSKISGSLSWRAGLMVHPLNPKAWVMTILAWTEFSPQLGSLVWQTVIICSSFAAAQLVLHSLWAFAGALLSRSLGASLWLNRMLVGLTCVVVIWTVLL
jgi:threonine/homoserine/homoserine lactone efflux protein